MPSMKRQWRLKVGFRSEKEKSLKKKINGVLVMEKTHKPCGPYERFFKRPIDFLCALSAIIVFSWLYIIVAILVKVKLGSPIIFTQQRPGKNEKIFKLYKFRTMTDEKDEEGNLLPDEIRLTKFGRLLRKTSLDELPEAFNILKGDSGIIGTTKKNLDFTGVSLA